MLVKSCLFIVSMLFSALLIHGCAPSDICASTVIPIPKGKNVNIADSFNYRGISLCSVFAKLFDLIFIDKFRDCLTTSDLQLDLKRSTPLLYVLWHSKKRLHIILLMVGLRFVPFWMQPKLLTV